MTKPQFKYCCLVGVENLTLSPLADGRADDRLITGNWKKALTRKFSARPGQIAEDFANEKDVLHFTRRYGPLSNPLSDFTAQLDVNYYDSERGTRLSEALPPFRFTEAEWCSKQATFQLIWETVSHRVSRQAKELADLIFPGIVGTEDLAFVSGALRLPVKGEFEISKGQTIFRAATMWELLLLDIFSVKKGHLRKCACDTCPAPYFVAERVNAKFCDRPECKDWNSRRIKLECWHRKKGPILEERKRIRLEEKHGTQKAR
jgi:hypothetical protein